jgi:hypothetical protein
MTTLQMSSTSLTRRSCLFLTLKVFSLITSISMPTTSNPDSSLALVCRTLPSSIPISPSLAPLVAMNLPLALGLLLTHRESPKQKSMLHVLKLLDSLHEEVVTVTFSVKNTGEVGGNEVRMLVLIKNVLSLTRNSFRSLNCTSPSPSRLEQLLATSRASTMFGSMLGTVLKSASPYLGTRSLSGIQVGNNGSFPRARRPFPLVRAAVTSSSLTLSRIKLYPLL